MKQMTLNQSQIDLMRFISFNRSEEEIHEIRDVLNKYFREKVNEKMKELWDNGAISNERLEEIKRMHLRTPYRQ